MIRLSSVAMFGSRAPHLSPAVLGIPFYPTACVETNVTQDRRGFGETIVIGLPNHTLAHGDVGFHEIALEYGHSGVVDGLTSRLIDGENLVGEIHVVIRRRQVDVVVEVGSLDHRRRTHLTTTEVPEGLGCRRISDGIVIGEE